LFLYIFWRKKIDSRAALAFQNLNNTASFLKGSGCSFMGGGYNSSFKETNRNSESIGVGLLRTSLANLEKSDP
jgi:hypothetical protein